MGIQGIREKQADIAMLNPSELYDYRESQKDYWDMYAVTETAEKKGRAEGLAEGMSKGLEKGRAEGMEEGMLKGLAEGILQTAKNMKQKGLDDQLISEITGLPFSEIKKL